MRLHTNVPPAPGDTISRCFVVVKEVDGAASVLGSITLNIKAGAYFAEEAILDPADSPDLNDMIAAVGTMKVVHLEPSLVSGGAVKLSLLPVEIKATSHGFPPTSLAGKYIQHAEVRIY